jgi:hypothetical protein
MKFQCCLCGKEIANSPPDPCSLFLKTTRDAYEEQGLYCHATCLRRVILPNIPLLSE